MQATQDANAGVILPFGGKNTDQLYSCEIAVKEQGVIYIL